MNRPAGRRLEHARIASGEDWRGWTDYCFQKMGARCPTRLGKQQDAAARKTRLIRIQLQRTGKPDGEITTEPLDLVLESISPGPGKSRAGDGSLFGRAAA